MFIFKRITNETNPFEFSIVFFFLLEKRIDWDRKYELITPISSVKLHILLFVENLNVE